MLHRTASAFVVAALVACALASLGAQSPAPTAAQQAKLATAPGAPKPPDVVPLESLPRETPQQAMLRKAIDAEVDAFAARAIEMNDWMYKNPETGFLEFKASAMMGDELKKQGFEVSYGVAGLDPTFDAFVNERFGQQGLKEAFVAKYKGGAEHPVVAFMLEADALREQGGKAFHGCQHNQQGPVAMASTSSFARTASATPRSARGQASATAAC